MLNVKKLLLFITILALTGNAFTQTGCPRGNVLNCKGMCGFYSPNNKYGYCRYSVLSDDIKNLIYGVKDTICAKNDSKDKINKDSAKTVSAKDDKFQKNNNNTEHKITKKEKESATVNPQNEIIQPDSTQNKTECTDTISDNNAKVKVPQNFNKPYDIISIFGVALLLYLFTYFLSRKRVIKKHNHKKIWNIILLITFLVTGLLGLFMVFQLNYNFEISWFRSLLYWHVEFGIAMAAISIFHILWHLKYFVNLFKKEKHHHKARKGKKSDN